MEIVTGDRYLESLVNFVRNNTAALIDGTLILKLNPVGLHYVQSRLETLGELERLISGAPVDYLRAYVSDLGDFRALEQLRKILCRLTSLKIVSVLAHPSRDPTPLSLIAFGRLKVLELRGCDLSTSAAKGLLELRHTLEKLICHNSTDALRHVFASRIADIKESPQWNRLSFVSCACNGLILMDESLQLLPAVETLDLSRNKFAKVDNLRKCTRLTHLDLGFNQLRSVASFSEVTCHILKLVLRSNALTTLRGIENLKFIEGLDVSYNIISNYVELEVLSSLPSLKHIWLEGNPLCCARWYRPQVFSFFPHAEQVKLDEKEMSTREYWKRQIIIARRHRKPASYGFYSPAREDNEVEEAFINGKRKKFSRLACIESEETEMNIPFDHDSCDNDLHGEEEHSSDNEGDLTSLINRIEFMKKERSKLWLDEFKDLMDQDSENWVDENKNSQATLPFGCSTSGDRSSWRHIGESSRYLKRVSDSIMNSGGSSSFASSSTGNYGYQSLHFAGENGEIKPKVVMGALDEDIQKFYLLQGRKDVQLADLNSASDNTGVKDGYEINTSVNKSKELESPFGLPVSPPHYEEGILSRRHYLEEEFFQASVESYSAASSDSNTSCDEEVEYDYELLLPQNEQYIGDDVFFRGMNPAEGDKGLLVPEIGQGWGSRDLCVHQPTWKLGGQDNPTEVFHGNEQPIENTGEDVITSKKQDADCNEKKISKKKTKKRVVLLSEGSSLCPDNVKVSQQMQTESCNYCIGRAQGNVNTIPTLLETSGDADIEHYFNSMVADSSIHETCRQYIVCNCVVGMDPIWRERQVAVVLSSELKLYMILLNDMLSVPGNSLSLLASHKVDDVSEVVVGLGLLVIWVSVDEGTSYLLVTRCKEKTVHLFFMIGLNSHGETNRCSVRSLDQVQLKLFDRQIGGSPGSTIYLYGMVLFCHKSNKEEEWKPRSIFINGEHLVICIEDILHFNSLSANADAASYFTLDSCCSIAHVYEMVIEAKENQCVTLTIRQHLKVPCLLSIIDTMKLKCGFQNKTSVGRFQTWKLKWFSAESLCKFITLLEVIHRGTTASSLPIRFIT